MQCVSRKKMEFMFLLIQSPPQQQSVFIASMKKIASLESNAFLCLAMSINKNCDPKHSTLEIRYKCVHICVFARTTMNLYR